MVTSLNTRNKYLLLLGGVAVLLAMVFGVAKTYAQPSSVMIEATATATTTVGFVAPNGTTVTYQLDSNLFSSGKIANVGTVDSVSLFVQAAASSSSSMISITPQFSNNNVDWYNVGTATSTLSGVGTSTITTSTIYTWIPGTTATTGIVFLLPAVPALHERVVFSSSIGSSSIYAEVDLKKNPSTP